ncbi:MAG: AAA family ATPase [Chitinispirillia bacterium]
MDLFDQNRKDLTNRNAPLANRMRPNTLEDFVGQEHIIGHGRLLRRAIQIDQLSSLVFYGPPGTGKTTLARIIAKTTKAHFLSINAVLSGIKDIRGAISNAKEKLALYSKRTILFIDEVHRFNKAQQDALLPHVENGMLTLIGATTENPYFEVNKALISRSRIFQLKQLTEKDLKKIALSALEDPKRGYGNKKINIKSDALNHLVKKANGDARGVLNALELAVETTKPDNDEIIQITRDIIEDSIQQKAVLYDKDGDAHYDIISAFIKSVRGSDPDASLYWMAKMLYAGEDPRFIFRRMLILASEDVGLADPNALLVVNAAAQAFDYVGLPEGRFHMAQACLYLAVAPKSNTTLSFFDAIGAVTEENNDNVPDHLKDSSRDKDGLGHGKGYLYPHAYRDHWTAQQYLPDILQGKTFYYPSNQGYEKTISLDVTRRREAQIEAMIENGDSDTYVSTCSVTDNNNKNSRNQSNWKKRTSQTFGEQLSQIRDHIMDLANLKRNSLVLDLHARSGFLTFEVKRLAPDSTIWALCHTKKEYDAFKTMIQRFSPLERPIVILTKLNSIITKIQNTAGKNVSFDVIIGRNILADNPDKVSMIESFSMLLKGSGKIILAETVHNKSQRISKYINFGNSVLKKQFITAEDTFFSDINNPMVNWNVDTLKKECENKKLCVTTSETIFESIRHISNEEIDFWLRKADRGHRSSLGDQLRNIFSEKQMEKVRKTVHTQLGEKNVTWQTSVGYFLVNQ